MKTDHSEPHIIQLMPVPDGMKVAAIYKEDDGRETPQAIHIMGLYNDGVVQFIEPDALGCFECPDVAQNFVRYEITYSVGDGAEGKPHEC